MKKAILITLLCGIMILGIKGYGPKIGEKSDIQISKGDVSLTVKDGTITRKGVTLILANHSDKTVLYGEDYTLEIKKHGEWYKIKIDGDKWVNLSASLLNAGESRELEIDFEYVYGKLKKGTYRIIKDMDYENGKRESFNVAAEFTIK